MKYLLSAALATLFLVSCNNLAPIETSSENDLSAKVAYDDKIANKVVFESHYKMIVFAMKKGQDLKPHSAPMDAPLVMLEGSAKITIGDSEIIATKGDMINLPKDIDHGVYPITNCKFLLIK